MRKLGWFALRVAVAAFVLGSLLLLAANLYVQSHGVQQRIRVAVEASLQRPVHLQKTTVTPWDGLRLDGIAFRTQEPDGSSAAQGSPPADFFTAASFRLRFAWWPLLAQQRLVIERVLLDKPHLVWQQDDDGHWSFPPGQDRARLAEAHQIARGDAASSSPASPMRAPANAPSAATITPMPGTLPAVENSVEEAPEDARFKGFFALINKLHVRHGTMDFLDRAHRLLFRVEGINSEGAITDPHHVHGAVWFARAGVPSTGVALANYKTSVDFGEREGLTLRGGRGTLADGLLQTDFQVQPQEIGRTFSVRCSLDHVALGRLTGGSGGQPPLAQGEFNGNLECHGATDDPASRAGGGRLWLAGAKLRGLAPMKLLGQLLRINDLTQPEFKQADMDYKVDGTTLRIESLVLAATDIRIAARGTYLTDLDELDVHGRLTIDQAVSHQLPQFIESNFVRCGPESAGCRYLDFDVTGSADDPKSNLYDRLTAGPMKGFLDNLLAPKSKNPKNKIPFQEPHAPPSPESPHLP